LLAPAGEQRPSTRTINSEPDIEILSVKFLQTALDLCQVIIFNPITEKSIRPGQFKVTINDLCSKSRKKAITFPRQISMYLARKYTNQPLADIGRAFNRDHSTVVHSVRVISDQIARSGSVRGQIELISTRLEKQFL
jgi:hypothetical protein